MEQRTVYRVYVCQHRECKARGAGATWRTLERALARTPAAQAELIVAGCQARCELGPNITVHPGATKYCGVDAAAALQIVEQHLAGGAVVTALLADPWR